MASLLASVLKELSCSTKQVQSASCSFGKHFSSFLIILHFGSSEGEGEEFDERSSEEYDEKSSEKYDEDSSEENDEDSSEENDEKSSEGAVKCSISFVFL